MTFRYGSGVAVLPASIIKKIDRASKKDIKILLCLAAMPETMQKAESDPAFVSAACVACAVASGCAALSAVRLMCAALTASSACLFFCHADDRQSAFGDRPSKRHL
jgi:hypothetical protein